MCGSLVWFALEKEIGRRRIPFKRWAVALGRAARCVIHCAHSVVRKTFWRGNQGDGLHREVMLGDAKSFVGGFLETHPRNEKKKAHEQGQGIEAFKP